MHYLVSGKEMKLLDQNTSQFFHVPELVLMEQAAMAFVRKLLLLKKEFHTALILCGSGNNGGDGLAIARLLHQEGISVTLFPAGELAGHRTSSSYEVQKAICQAYQIPEVNELSETQSYDVVIDALFGTGLSREVTGTLAEELSEINRMSGWKVAVDIASGISSDTGALLGTAFLAEDTITFSYGKVGQYLWPGSDYCGNIHIVPMGITDESMLGTLPKIMTLDRADLKKLPERKPHSNKGTYGKLLVIAGSVNMAGAACFCTKAAYCMGSGLVRVFTPEANRIILQTKVPEAVLITYGESFEEELLLQLQWADAIVLGPGIGTDASASAITRLVIKNSNVPVVVDADALNILSKDCSLLKEAHAELIVTPHLGEMSRLTQKSVSKLQEDLVSAAETFAQTYQTVCVLKDFHTVSAAPDQTICLNLSGNNGMATAGSGDVLSGILGSLLAQGLTPKEAAFLGVYVHGLAGDAAREKCGVRGLLASDIIEGLKEVENHE